LSNIRFTVKSTGMFVSTGISETH